MVADVNSDQQQKGLETDVTYDRATAARLGVTVSELDSTLYDAFGQRQVSTIYNALNQYHVVMEVAPRYWQSPQTLDDIYVSTSGGAATGTQSSNLLTAGGGATSPAIGGSGSGGIAAPPWAPSAVPPSNPVQNAALQCIANTGRGAVSSGAAVSARQETMVPLAAVSSLPPAPPGSRSTIMACSPRRPSRSTLQPGMSLSDATRGGRQAMQAIHMPTSIHGMFAGTAGTFQHSLSSEPLLIAAGIARGLHRARRALRELRPPDHHHLDPALRRRRRRARAHGVAHRVQHHRADRRDPAHRYRQEERHHDDRLRHHAERTRGSRRARPSTRRACCAFGPS